MELFDYTYEVHGNFKAGYSCNTHYKPTEASYLFKTFRILHIKEGMVRWKVGVHVHTLRPGDMVLFNNILPRKILKIYNGPLIYDLFAFSPEFINDPLTSKIFFSNECKVMDVQNHCSEKIYLILGQLKSEFALNNKYKGDIIEKLMHTVLLYIARFTNLPNENALCSNTPRFAVLQATRYIQDNLSSELTVPLLAKMCGYSNEHFSRLFKDYMGTSAKAYIINARIENALQLINNESYRVLDAALQSGFNTSSAFYKAFKKHKNSSPLGYSKSYVRE